jgi:hypothetical protein
VCDSDSDGELTFSEFLRFVDLCDLNPDDHISVENELLESAFTRIAAAAATTATTTPAAGSGASPVQLISFRDACEYKVSACYVCSNLVTFVYLLNVQLLYSMQRDWCRVTESKHVVHHELLIV